MTRAMTLVDWSLLLAAALLLGSTFLFLNITIKEISPFTTAAFRTLIAAPICWGLMRGSVRTCHSPAGDGSRSSGSAFSRRRSPSVQSPGANNTSRVAWVAYCSAPCQS